MGKKLDALLGRTFKVSKLKTLLGLAVSRLAVLKNQRQVRASHARNDVSQLLQIALRERALLRVEHFIKEQNMLDAFVMIEGYCNLVLERVVLIQNHPRGCPEELKEAISGLIFASSRCGDFPELLEIREIFTDRFGKDFTSSAVELRNHCGVNPKIIQKMSTRQPSLESRLNAIKEIASENGIAFNIEEPFTVEIKESNLSRRTDPRANPGTPKPGAKKPGDGGMGDGRPAEMRPDDGISGSMESGDKKYRDVASAAQAAFESAAQAALAARAAVELSKSEHSNQGSDDDQHSAPDTGGRSSFGTPNYGLLRKSGSHGSDFEKILPLQLSGSESEDEEPTVEVGELLLGTTDGKIGEKLGSLDSAGMVNGKKAPPEKEIHFDESDDEAGEKGWGKISSKPYELQSDMMAAKVKEATARRADLGLEENHGFEVQRQKQQSLMMSQADSEMEHQKPSKMRSELEMADEHSQGAEMGRNPFSVRRARRIFRH